MGDGFDNAGEHNTCHNAAMRAVTAVISADAVGQIRHGDKKDPARTADINDGHAIDVAKLGGDAATGRDVSHEIKTPSPTVQKFGTGQGSREHGGCCASMGMQRSQSVCLTRASVASMMCISPSGSRAFSHAQWNRVYRRLENVLYVESARSPCTSGGPCLPEGSGSDRARRCGSRVHTRARDRSATPSLC